MALEIIGEILKLMVFAGLALAGILVILIWMKDLTRKVSYLRLFIQIVSLVGIYYLFTYPVWLVLVLSMIFIMTLVSGRFFCGWICPFGLYIDLITLLRKAFKIRYRNLSEKLNRALHVLRYGLLVFFLILPFLLSPINPWQWPLALFLAGPFKLLRILLAPLTSLIVPWTEELTAINGLNLSYPYLDQIIAYSSENLVWIFIFIFVALTVASSFFMRRFWCRFCPTGSSLAIVNRFRGFKWFPILHIDKDEEKCTKCGICKRVCPLQVTEVYEQKGGKITTSMCMLCFRCVEMCPYEDCLKVKFAGKIAFKSRNWLEPSESE
jgi:NosR/NirI family nitrous oxide reductase transcriptional regulator